MILEDLVRLPELRGRARQAPLGPHIDHILTAIEPVGYKFGSLRDLVYGLIRFGTYLLHEQRLTDLGHLRLHHVESFVATQPL